MKFSDKLIKLRKEKGLSQEELGNELNVSRQAVSKWESEHAKPDTEKIVEISKFFDVTIDYLLNDELDETNQNVQEKEIQEPKKSKKMFLKIFIIIFLIYICTVIYKFVTLTVIYNIANSFSEDNYWMNISTLMHSDLQSKDLYIEHDITKSNNTYYLSTSAGTSEDDIDYDKPDHIVYKNKDLNKEYELNYDKNTDKYIYHELSNNDYINDMEINDIKEGTLDNLPKNKILFAINPLNLISKHHIKIIKFDEDFNKVVTSIRLNDDGLIEYIYEDTDKIHNDITYSYDYVPEHFTDDTVVGPLDDEDFEYEIQN